MQLSKRAIERDESKRENFYRYMVQNYTTEQLVFVDESAVDKRVAFRNRGWARSGERAVMKTNFVQGQR
jgi:hypothetical protein